MDENDVEQLYDKPMSEENKEVKGLQRDINRFHAGHIQKHEAAVAKIADNNVKLSAIREANDKKARFEKWAQRDPGAIIAAKAESQKTAANVAEEKVPEPV